MYNSTANGTPLSQKHSTGIVISVLERGGRMEMNDGEVLFV